LLPEHLNTLIPSLLKRIILDVDTGVDDALAILLALRSTELKVEAITTVSGNAPVELCTRNTLIVLNLLGDMPLPVVAPGAAVPLRGELETALYVHGDDGLGGVTRLRNADGTLRYPAGDLCHPQPSTLNQLAATLTHDGFFAAYSESGASTPAAVWTILHLIRKFPHDITLVATGPLTNVARAIREDRETMRLVKEIYVMGGAFRVYGNTKTMTEFNVDVDPQAAKEVLELGAPVTMVPLDVTEQVRLMRPDAERMAREHPSRITEFIHDVTQQYMDYHVQHDGFDGCFLHDPLTVGVVLCDEFVDTVDAFVQVETKGEFTAGMTIADLRGRPKPSPNARVCVAVKAKAFLEFFWERMIDPPQSPPRWEKGL